MIEFSELKTWPLHTGHNSFEEGVPGIYSHFKEFAIEILKLCKLSSARREDYKFMENITEVPAELPSSTHTLVNSKVCCNAII